MNNVPFIPCPKCVGKLEPDHLGKAQIYFCNICHGLWMKPHQLRHILFQGLLGCATADLDHLHFSAVDVEHITLLENADAYCPFCHYKTILKKDIFRNVWRCPHRHGLWLDGGDIYLLRQRYLNYEKTALIFLLILFLAWMGVLLCTSPRFGCSKHKIFSHKTSTKPIPLATTSSSIYTISPMMLTQHEAHDKHLEHKDEE